MCCCFQCMCSNKRLDDLTCCCCFPISCGMYTIAIIIFLLTVFLFTEVFFMLLDDEIAWYYVFVAVLTLLPAVVGCGFAVRWLMINTQTTRWYMIIACILICVSVVLLVGWNTWYFIEFYEAQRVVSGKLQLGGEISTTTKVQVFYALLIACVILTFFAYFICVTCTYKDALYDDEDEEMEEEMEKMKEEMMMKMEDMMDKMMEE